MESRSLVDLPPQVKPPFEVFVNGIPQTLGTDYTVEGSTLVFQRELAQEGPLGFWRWVRMVFGIAGTYRKNDQINVTYNPGERPVVLTLSPRAEPPPE